MEKEKKIHTEKLKINKLLKNSEYLIVELHTPIKNLNRVLNINVLGIIKNPIIDYRYSNDDTIWSEWITWNKWDYSPQEFTWLNFRIKSEYEGNFESLEIEWYGDSLLGEQICYVSVHNDSGFIVPCGNNIQYEYNSAMNAIKIWESLTKSVFNRFGWNVVYFKCDAVKQSKDVFFKEYSLLQVRECKCLKVVVPDNNFGSGDLQFTEFDIDFADDLEIQIYKEHFWTAFGLHEQPNEKDFLYFPIEGRMYRVNSIQESKDFMRKSIWWKGSLVKWNESDSISYKDDSTKNTINEFTLDFESVGFDTEMLTEEIDTVKPQQYQMKSVGKSDSVRDFVNLEWESKGILEQNLDNYFTVFSKYQYNLDYPDTKKLVPGGVAVNGGPLYEFVQTKLVSYSSEVDLSKDFSLMFWYYANKRNKSDNTWKTLFSDLEGTDFEISILVQDNLLKKLKINTKEYEVNVPVSEWYAYYIGFNNLDKSFVVRIWERADISKKTTKMSIFYENIYTNSNWTGTWNPVLMNSSDKITSIRILKYPVTVEHQSTLLTKLIFPDDSKSYSIDNCYPIMYVDNLSQR